jgi:hypothetical protein
VAVESHFDFLPKTHEQRDNHRPGCQITGLVTNHQKSREVVGARHGMAGAAELGLLRHCVLLATVPIHILLRHFSLRAGI